jgi:hypothetical protein
VAGCGTKQAEEKRAKADLVACSANGKPTRSAWPLVVTGGKTKTRAWATQAQKSAAETNPARDEDLEQDK